MFRFRGLGSFFLCQTSQKIFKSTNLHDSPHPFPHINSPPTTKDLFLENSYGYVLKVRNTYLEVYGCSRMGVSPPIHH
ncbi:hypothetical protein RchiOBHm_Chr4g0408041 [Rosa chinensis]|uniref:Uncharacterized protein n=1 Tax=Rosa chinensis TaxID=74649 RepID=A0A2P6QUR8_ROSCH|nr:hypothetical protein RchiOBHm_Chr4g0408041 [Rosa chinensis]